jgi:Ca2+-binding EF-hand superfamily protein
VLQSDEGFLSLQSFLVSHQTLYLDQITFQNILSNILADYDEFEAVEVFDILETTGDGVLTIKEFYVFALLQAAVESDQALLCLYYHGPLIFDVIAGGQDYIDGDRVESILRLTGLEEVEIQNKLKEFDIDSSAMVSGEQFQLLLFSIFKEVSL